MSHMQLAPANPANKPSLRFFSQVGIRPTMRVLDVGCGNGDLSRLVAGLVGPRGEVFGIDRSDEALASARTVPPQPEAAPISYHIADLSGDLPDLGKFDAIVGRRVLMYLPDAAATLAQLARLAKTGTTLAFQEHARADLPSGVDALPVHHQCYCMVWNTVAAEGGDVALGYRLAGLVRAAGFEIQDARSEGVLIQPWEQSFLPTLARVMLPRMIEQGLVRTGDVDLDTLAQGIEEEHRTAKGTIFWDLAFLVSGRF